MQPSFQAKKPLYVGQDGCPRLFLPYALYTGYGGHYLGYVGTLIALAAMRCRRDIGRR
jgi:hypothetical protein